MGLDGIEILLEVEETFGIRILDEEAARIRTVGDLYARVLQDLATMREKRGESFCASASAFYALRRGFTRALSLPREMVLPSALTSTLLGWRHRRANWHRIGTSAEVQLPSLRRPRWLVWPLLGAVCGVALRAGWWMRNNDAPMADSIGLCVAVLIVLAMISFIATRPVAVKVPRGCEKVGGLAQEVARSNYGTLVVRMGRIPGPAEVWVSLRDLLAKQLGVPAERVTPEARLIEDLGMA